jgi:hypothetical protein
VWGERRRGKSEAEKGDWGKGGVHPIGCLDIDERRRSGGTGSGAHRRPQMRADLRRRGVLIEFENAIRTAQ